MSFVHLRIHSDFSLSDSTLRISDLTSVKGHDAIAITDDNNLFGAIKFYSGTRKNGVKPIVGSEINIETPYGQDTLVFLAKNNAGYKNIMKMISAGYERREKKESTPFISWEEFQQYKSDVFILSGARGSLLTELLHEGDPKALEYAKALKKEVGDNYFIELQRVGLEGENDYIENAVSLAGNYDIPVVATNNVRFLNKDDFQTHEIREAIAQGAKLMYMRQNTNNYSPEQYLKTPEQMAELFSDIPSAISNTEYIAKSCNLEIELGKDYLPDFPVEEGYDTASYLVKLANEGLQARLEKLYPDPSVRAGVTKDYQDRLDYELDVINNMGFPGYFLIVMEFIQWSKDNDIPVGPGRGSGAGSLVAYSLKITDLDPMEYELLFERFLNPERVSMPDFDIDFCIAGRDRVIAHVAELYGHEAVSQIATFGTMAAKMVIKDVARALNHPYSFGHQLSNLIPNRPGIKLKEAIEEVPALKMRIEDDPQVAEVFEHSLKLEGTVRQVGKHAGGVLISPTTISDFSPLYKETAMSPPVSQFDKNDVESVGLVKFDFLGLKTMTVIHKAVKLANLMDGVNFDIEDIPIDDPASYEIIKSANTTGVFQLESAGMKSLIRRLEPENFEEVIALVALFRPGPLDSGMVDTYINCKKGIEKIKYPDPLLEPVLNVTNGVFVYQEQVMKAAQVMGGYSLGQADLLRKAMGKKLPEEMVKQRKMFVDGCVAKELDKDHAGDVFNLMETFAGYGFNKSHSAAYALIAVYTAYMKAHYPSPFYAALMTADADSEDKIVRTISDAKENGVEILAPCINLSKTEFTVVEGNKVLFGLSAIKGVGETIQKKIEEERERNGDFKHMFDFMARVRPNKTVLASLIYSGALDSLGLARNKLHRIYTPSLKHLDAMKKEIKKDPTIEGELVQRYSDVWLQLLKKGFDGDLDPVIPPTDLIVEERKRLGFYLTSHPQDSYRQELKAFGAMSLASFNEIDGIQIMDNKQKGGDGNVCKIAGAVTEIKVDNNKKGMTAQVTIDDGTSQVKLRIRNKMYNAIYHILEKDTVLCFKVALSYNAQSDRRYTQVHECEDIAMVRQRLTKNVTVNIDLDNPVKRQVLKEYLQGMTKGSYKILVNNTTDPDQKPHAIRDGRMISDEDIENIRNICDTDDAVEFTFYDSETSMEVDGINKDEVDEEVVNEELLKLDRAFKQARVAMGLSM